MATLDVEVLRVQIRSSDHSRSTPEQIAMWRVDMGESRANLAIESMNLDTEDESMSAMMLDEGLSPRAMVEIIRALYANRIKPANARVSRAVMGIAPRLRAGGEEIATDLSFLLNWPQHSGFVKHQMLR